MLLKKIYEKNAAGKPVRVSHVAIGHTGTHAEQNFSSGLVAAGVSDGWITISGDQLVMKAYPEDLVYTVKRAPGYYCVHDGARMPISELALAEFANGGKSKLAAREAAAYLEAHGYAGVKSTDPRNPAGYLRSEVYECVLESRQHEKYKARGNPLVHFARELAAQGG